MVINIKQPTEINVLASQANWAWPAALHNIFQPRGINLLVAQNTNEFIDVIKHRRVHTTIIDMDCEDLNGLATIKIIRTEYPMMPCLALSSRVGEGLLEKALELEVFSVINKPVEMDVLQGQLNRIFVKRYNSNIFED